MDIAGKLNNLKKHIFLEFMDTIGRAFALVRYSENVVLGNRGFTQEEKENGIVLVFNSKMNFLWDEHGITANLVFGTSSQKCFIPADSIMAVYSPELNAQFVSSPLSEKKDQKPQQWNSSLAPKDSSSREEEKGKIHKGGRKKTARGEIKRPTNEMKRSNKSSQNVIKVDFIRKRKDS
ncbi:MAG: ClpXP protease specificity-enhancing factor SspB [Dissulfurispiraceae bacterium]